MQAADVGKIVTDYGAILAGPSPLGLVRDINSLPHLKTEIKAALKLGLFVTTDAALREQLKFAYLSLADFQKLSDGEARAVRHWDEILSKAKDLDAVDARTISAEAELIIAVRERMVNERKALQEELEAGGF